MQRYPLCVGILTTLVAFFFLCFIHGTVGVPLPFGESSQRFAIPLPSSPPLRNPTLPNGNQRIHHRSDQYQGSVSSGHESRFNGPNTPGRVKRHSDDERNFIAPNNHNHHHYFNDHHHEQAGWRLDPDTSESNNLYHHHQRQRRESPPHHTHSTYQQRNNNAMHSNTNNLQNGQEQFRTKHETNSPYIVEFDKNNDWQTAHASRSNEEWIGGLTPPNNGYCTTPDCLERLVTNNIRNERKHQGLPSSKVWDLDPRRSNPPDAPNPWLVQIPTDQYGDGEDNRNPNGNNKIPLPLQILVPPTSSSSSSVQESYNTQRGQERFYQNEYPKQQPTFRHKDENLDQFYGQQFPASENYIYFSELDSLRGDDSQLGTNEFPRSNKGDSSSLLNEMSSKGEHISPSGNTVIIMRTSSISVGDGLEVFRVVLNVSEEDDDETNLEVEDQS